MLSRKFLERVRAERTVDTTSDWQVVATYNGYTARWNRCKPQ